MQLVPEFKPGLQRPTALAGSRLKHKQKADMRLRALMAFMTVQRLSKSHANAAIAIASGIELANANAIEHATANDIAIAIARIFREYNT